MYPWRQSLRPIAPRAAVYIVPQTRPCRRCGSHLGKLVTARLLQSPGKRGRRARDRDGPRTDEGTVFALGPTDLGQALTDLPTLVRGSLAWWDHKTRTPSNANSSPLPRPNNEGADGIPLSRNLLRRPRGAARAAGARRHLQARTTGFARGQASWPSTKRSFYVKGWMRNDEAEITRLTAVSPEGVETEIFEGTFRYPRPDVEQFAGPDGTHPRALQPVEEAGFISYFETEVPSRLPGRLGFPDAGRLQTTARRGPPLPAVVHDDLAVEGVRSSGISFTNAFPHKISPPGTCSRHRSAAGAFQGGGRG